MSGKPVRLELSREQILGYRREAGWLNERLPASAKSLRLVASAGLQDSMPRAALFSMHARVKGCGSDFWEHPSLVQLWGPRFNVYVVAAKDLPVFSLGRLPDNARGRKRAYDTASRLQALLDGRRMPMNQAGKTMGLHPNSFRYAAPTGTVLLRWDGAHDAVVWSGPPPKAEPPEARLELARRYLHIFGPSMVPSFAGWAGIGTSEATAVSMDSQVSCRLCTRRSAMLGSLPMTKLGSGKPLPRSPLRQHVFCPAATLTFCCGHETETFLCPTQNDGQSFGQRAFGPAHC